MGIESLLFSQSVIKYFHHTKSNMRIFIMLNHKKLIVVAVVRNSKTVNALIDAGSYVKHKDNKGKRAVNCARENPKFKGTDALERLEELSR